MTKFPSLKPRQVEKILLKNGFIIKRQSGSHRTYHNPSTEAVTVVSFHSSDIPAGTLRSIVKQSRLAEPLFIKGKH